ncbi:MAG: hypothetical protein ACF8QF_14785 [Phycisphaerales bacterium]
MSFDDANTASPDDFPPPDVAVIEVVARYVQSLMAERGRGLVIVAASVLETEIRECIDALMVSPETKGSRDKYCFQLRSGALWTNAQLAYSLGVFSDGEMSAVNVIRQARDQASHLWTEVDLGKDSDSVRQLLLQIPWIKSTGRSGHSLEEKRLNIEGALRGAVASLAIQAREAKIRAKPRKPGYRLPLRVTDELAKAVMSARPPAEPS